MNGKLYAQVRIINSQGKFLNELREQFERAERQKDELSEDAQRLKTRLAELESELQENQEQNNPICDPDSGKANERTYTT